MSKFIPLRNHSHYSLQLGLKRPKHIVEKCANEGYEFAGICDVSTISGCVTFIKSCKDKGIKPIIGSEILLKDGSSISLFCRNIEGWKDLLKLISALNDDDLELNQVLSHITPSNFICVDGYVGSAAFSSIVSSTECIFNSADYDDAMSCLYEDWKTRFDTHVKYMIGLFGEGYFLESNEFDSDTFPAAKIASECVANYSDIAIPSSNSYYCERKDSIDHRILICSKLKTTMKKLTASIMSSCDIRLLSFIRSSNYYVKSRDAEHNSAYLLNMSRIPGLIQDFKILSKPRLPKFDCPNEQDENEYLKQLCRNGWTRVIHGKIPKEEENTYKDRVLKELDVIKKAELAGYFLIVQDYVNHFRNQGYLIGPARGSGAGSLVCYLIGITLIDPIRNGLIFERFYNEGRNTKDHVSLPDIDVDFPPSIRSQVFDYLRTKYGDHRVCQMATFGRLQGKSILKEILRINELCSNDQMNEITKLIPNDAEISDELENMEKPSTIIWALENVQKIRAYCYIGENEELEGEFAKAFDQAIRMEGVFKSMGKHAAGVVISSDSLEEICPMVKAARGSEKIAGMEMADLEAIGCVKFDILGVSLLSKVANTVNSVNTGEIK